MAKKVKKPKKPTSILSANRLNLISMRADFRDNIFENRKKWHIPLEGLKDEDQYQEWNRSLIKKSDNYIKGEYFFERRNVIKKMMKDSQKRQDIQAYKKAEDLLAELNASTPINEFEKDLENILLKFKLSHYYKDAMKSYLKTNTFGSMWLHHTVPEKIVSADGRGDKLVLEIYPETTIEDVRGAWLWVDELQQTMPGYKEGRRRYPTISDKNKRIWELSLMKTRYDKIATIINKEYPTKQVPYYADISRKVAALKKIIMSA